MQHQQLAVLHQLLDRARPGPGRKARVGVDLRVEEEGAGTEQRLGVDDPARLP